MAQQLSESIASVHNLYCLCSFAHARAENLGQLLIMKQQQFHDHLEAIDEQHKDYQEKVESDLAAKAAQVKQYHKRTMAFKEQVEQAHHN